MASPPALFLNPGALVVRREHGEDEDGDAALEAFDNEAPTAWPQSDPYWLLHAFSNDHHHPVYKRGLWDNDAETRVHKFENDRLYLQYLHTVLKPGGLAPMNDDWCTHNRHTVDFATDEILRELLYKRAHEQQRPGDTGPVYEAWRADDVYGAMLDERVGNGDTNPLLAAPVCLLDGSNMFYTNDATEWTSQSSMIYGSTFNPAPKRRYQKLDGSWTDAENITGFDRYFDFKQNPGEKLAMYLQRRTEARHFFLSHLHGEVEIQARQPSGEDYALAETKKEHYIFERGWTAPDPTTGLRRCKMYAHLMPVHDGLAALETLDNGAVHKRLIEGVLSQRSEHAPAGPVVIMLNEKSYNNLCNKASTLQADLDMVQQRLAAGADLNELRYERGAGGRIQKVFFNARDKQGKSLFYRVLEATECFHKWQHPVIFAINDEYAVDVAKPNNNRDVGGNHVVHQKNTKRGLFVFHDNTPTQPSLDSHAEHRDHYHNLNGTSTRTAFCDKILSSNVHANKEWDDALLSRVRDRLDKLGMSVHLISDDRDVYKTDHPFLPLERCDDECMYPVAHSPTWNERLVRYEWQKLKPSERSKEAKPLSEAAKRAREEKGSAVPAQVSDRGDLLVPLGDNMDKVFDFMTILSQRMSRRGPPSGVLDGIHGGVGLQNALLKVRPYFTGVVRALQGERVRTYPWTPYVGEYLVKQNSGRVRVNDEDETVSDFVTWSEMGDLVSAEKRPGAVHGPFPRLPTGRDPGPGPGDAGPLDPESVLRGNVMRDTIVGQGTVSEFGVKGHPCAPRLEESRAGTVTDEPADPRLGERWVMEHRRHLLLLLRDLAIVAEKLRDAEPTQDAKQALNNFANTARVAANAHAAVLKGEALVERNAACNVDATDEGAQKLRQRYREEQLAKTRRMHVLDKMRSVLDRNRYDSTVETRRTAIINTVYDPASNPNGMFLKVEASDWDVAYRMYYKMCVRLKREPLPYEHVDLAAKSGSKVFPLVQGHDTPMWYVLIRNWFGVYAFVTQRMPAAQQCLFEEDSRDGWPRFAKAALGNVNWLALPGGATVTGLNLVETLTERVREWRENNRDEAQWLGGGDPYAVAGDDNRDTYLFA